MQTLDSVPSPHMPCSFQPQEQHLPPVEERAQISLWCPIHPGRNQSCGDKQSMLMAPLPAPTSSQCNRSPSVRSCSSHGLPPQSFTLTGDGPLSPANSFPTNSSGVSLSLHLCCLSGHQLLFVLLPTYCNDYTPKAPALETRGCRVPDLLRRYRETLLQPPCVRKLLENLKYLSM